MGTDLIEIRLDYLKDLREIGKIVESTSTPLIATDRQYRQGGHKVQREDRRIQTLIDSANIGFQYVDIESTTADLESVIQQLKEAGSGVIVSFHDFKRTPDMSELEKIVRSQMSVNADVCKIVTTANEMADNVTCLILTWKMRKITKVVCFAMGERGVISRVLSPIFGGYYTYASVKKGLEAAPGQLPLSDLKKLYGKLGVEVGDFRKN